MALDNDSRTPVHRERNGERGSFARKRRKTSADDGLVYSSGVYWLIAILGLAALMVVHEMGHYLAARRYGLRVTRFSIGFGPTFFKVQPIDGFFYLTAFGDRIKVRLFKHDPEKHGPTIFQVAMIPFLAYVQIAGMNPFEETDPNDKGAYVNAGLWARIVTIAGGPVANYLFASVFFFFAFYMAGSVPADPTQFDVVDNRPAQRAGLASGDRVVSIDGVKIEDFGDVPEHIKTKAGKEVTVVVLRDGKDLSFTVVPEDEAGTGRIGIQKRAFNKSAGIKDISVAAVKMPTVVVRDLLDFLGKWVRGKVEGEVTSVVGTTRELKKAAERGFAEYLALLGALSAYLAAFNLFPLPALDGGRLMFLSYEAATRRKPNPTLEAQVHFVGIVLMLGLMLYITFAKDLFGSK